MVVTAESFLWRRTLIAGDVNTGKTRLTQRILDALTAAGLAADIAVIDLAPSRTQGVGGKFNIGDDRVDYRTTRIVPPRLTARHEDHALELARRNARAVEDLLEIYHRQPRPLLLVNDATLYLQAGALETFLALLATASTAVVNAYQGRHFPDSALTRRERHMTDLLASHCDCTIRTPLDLTEELESAY